jgi:hypothetical protein
LVGARAVSNNSRSNVKKTVRIDRSEALYFSEAIPILKNHFRLEFRKKRIRKIAAFKRIKIAAAGLGDTAALRFRRSAAVLKASRSNVISPTIQFLFGNETPKCYF